MSGVTPGTGIFYSGNVFLARYVNNVLGNYIGPINTSMLSLKADGDAKRRKSSQIGKLGQNQELKYMPKPTAVEFTCDEQSRDLIAGALLGTASTYSQANASDQTVTKTLVLGEWVELGVMNIGSVAIPSCTVGVDFEVLQNLGMVKALTSNAAGSKTITFDRGAIAGDKIAVATQNVVEYAIKAEVQNISDGQHGVLIVPKASMTPGAAMTFVGATDFQDLKFSGEIVVLPNQDPATFYPALTFTTPS